MNKGLGCITKAEENRLKGKAAEEVFGKETETEEERKEIKIESITAESISNDEQGNLLLKGKVFIKTNLLTFSTDTALYNQSEGIIELFGNGEVKSEKVKLNSSEVLANLNRQVFFEKTKYKLFSMMLLLVSLLWKSSESCFAGRAQF